MPVVQLTSVDDSLLVGVVGTVTETEFLFFGPHIIIRTKIYIIINSLYVYKFVTGNIMAINYNNTYAEIQLPSLFISYICTYNLQSTERLMFSN